MLQSCQSLRVSADRQIFFSTTFQIFSINFQPFSNLQARECTYFFRQKSGRLEYWTAPELHLLAQRLCVHEVHTAQDYQEDKAKYLMDKTQDSIAQEVD